MLTLAYPWLLALLPLPLLVRWLAPARREPRQALVVPFLDRLARDSGQNPLAGAVVMRGGRWRVICLTVSWCAVVLAIARPQIIEPPITREIPARDLLLAVDLSGSMATKDFKNASGQMVDRLAAVKSVLDDFLAQRQGDRVGLIFFGSAPFVQAPFTEDLKVCRELLDEAQVNMAGQQTAFGDALGLAINEFDRSPVKTRVLIALTDGNDTASKMPPAKAAEVAKDKGIVIHTISVGDPRAAGEDALDVAALKNVAATTGGLYSHAADQKQLEAIYHQLDQLETRKTQIVTHHPRRDVFWWPLAAGLGVTLLQHALQLLRRKTAKPVKLTTAPPAFASLAPFGLAVSSFPAHFIRPAWLLALIPAAWLWWWLRRHTAATQPWRGVIAPHLLPHLLSGRERKSRFNPLALIGLGWLVTIIAIAGPTWRRAPAPFADDAAALAIVVKVTPSMMTEDVQPGRLARSVEKIRDLLAERRGAKTSLIAYAGSAHVVMPATTDDGIINTFAQALNPKIMPGDGDAAADAFRLADETLADAGGGSILWIADGVAAEQVAPLAAWRKKSGTDVRLFPPLLPGAELDAVISASHAADAGLIRLTADDSDVKTLARAARFSPAADGEAGAHWEESGYWLTPAVALLALPFFRKGWMTATASKI